MRASMAHLGHSRATTFEKPRRSFQLPRSPLVLIDALSRKSVSYNKLPDEPLKLSVLKLDGSRFDIEVIKTANVADLKLAVEAVFCHLPQKGPGKISWHHVWGHFCLCYNGQKLIIDSDYLKGFGIKDGDQLHFMRHVSISYNLIKKRSGKRFVAPKQKSTRDEDEEERNKSEKSERKVSSHVGCFMGRRRGDRERRVVRNISFLGSLKKAFLRSCFDKWQNRNISSSNTYLVK